MFTRSLLRTLFALVLAVSVVVVAPPVAAQEGVSLDSLGGRVFLPFVGGQERYPPDNRAFEVEAMRLVNEARVSAGLQLLTEHTALTNAARRHAEDMAANNFVDHVGSDGTEVWDRARQEGFPHIYCSEVMAINVVSPAIAVNVLVGSSAHRDLLLADRFQEMGTGYSVISGRTYLVGVLCRASTFR